MTPALPFGSGISSSLASKDKKKNNEHLIQATIPYAEIILSNLVVSTTVSVCTMQMVDMIIRCTHKLAR
jgi:hypothetical protein